MNTTSYALRITHYAIPAIVATLIMACAIVVVLALGVAPPAPFHGILAPPQAALRPTSQVLCVDDNGGSTGGAPCTNTTAFTLIQDAINAALDGDEVRVAAGTYVTSTGTTVITLDRGVTLTGGYAGGVGGWNTPGNETLTVIDGQGVRDGITVSGFAGTVVAQNVSVINGGIVMDANGTFNNNMPIRTRNLSQSTGTIGGSAPITVTNVFTFTSGNQVDTGHTDILPGAQLNITGAGGVALDGSRAINNYGAATWSGAIPISLFGGATINNQAGATFSILNNQQMGTGGTFNNFGTIVKSSAGDTTINYPATFNNSGQVQINNGRLLFGLGSSTGTYNVAAGATLGICNCGAHTFQPTSVITGAGTFESGFQSTIDGVFTLPNLDVSAGGVDINSVGANTASTVMTLTISGGILGGTRTISMTNLLNWTSGDMTGAGHTDILSGAQLNFTGPAYADGGRVINNYGTTTLSGAANVSLGNGGSPSTFNNRSGGAINILNNNRFGDEGLSSGALNNLGTITRSGSAGIALFSFVTGTFTNQGLVDVQSGTLQFQGDVGHVSQTAGTTRMSGGSLQFDYSPFLLQGGTLEGAGTITGSVNNTGGTVSPGLGPGLITITGNYTQGAGGTLNIELGGLTPITQYDRLAVGGTATLNGILNTSAINGFTPQNGDNFTVLTYGSGSGTFSTIQGGTYTTNYNPGDLTLVVGGPASTPTSTGTATATRTPSPTGTPPTATRTTTRTPTGSLTHTPVATPTNYIIIPQTGTVVPGTTDIGNHCDACTTRIALPFAATLYDRQFSSVVVGSNGTLGFVRNDNPNTISCLASAAFDFAILTFWDDLNTVQTPSCPQCGIYTSISGNAPDRVFNIEWRAMLRGGTRMNDFEVRLYERQSRFDLVYGQLDAAASASIGVQRDTGSEFISVLCQLSGAPQQGQRSKSDGWIIADGVLLSFRLPDIGPTPTPIACPLHFSDVPQGSTFYSYVRCLACRDIINGYSDGTFKPSNNVTRGQLSKMVSNAVGLNDDPGEQMFEDVPIGSTFYDFVQRLGVRGYVGGYPCGDPGEPCGADNLPYFRPNGTATRGQTSKIVSNAASFAEQPAGQSFEDVSPGSTFYLRIERLSTRGIINGYPCGEPDEPCVPPLNRPYFRPGLNVTRGQTAKIVANTFFPNCNTPSR